MNKLLGYLVSICTVVFLTGTVSVPAMAQSTTSTEVAILPETPAEIAQQIQDEVAEILNDAGVQVGAMDRKALFGVGGGMLAGALIADMLGGHGLVTVGGVILGGFTGIWAADNLF
tara:strand:+ start:1148 stop:1495 length:348 start_codon:yes stop_codon:yes gene_type:complete